jgi:hypothetical protein
MSLHPSISFLVMNKIYLSASVQIEQNNRVCFQLVQLVSDAGSKYG